MTRRLAWSTALLVIVAAATAGCGKKTPPMVAAPPPSGPSAFPSASGGDGGGAGAAATANRPPAPPAIPADSTVRSSPLGSWEDKPVEAINGPDSPLKPILFAYDRDEIDDPAKKTLAANAELLKTYRTWVVTVEGHCDERGTAEYNLALGDRRALAAKNYLVSLGISADRLRTVSYGKEFPFETGHDEGAWAKNRRAHFMLTSK